MGNVLERVTIGEYPVIEEIKKCDESARGFERDDERKWADGIWSVPRPQNGARGTESNQRQRTGKAGVYYEYTQCKEEIRAWNQNFK